MFINKLNISEGINCECSSNVSTIIVTPTYLQDNGHFFKTSIAMANKNIGCIEDYAFAANCTTSTSLVVSTNKITGLSNYSLYGLSVLSHLELRYNKIAAVENIRGALECVKSTLIGLYLQGNLITTVPDYAFS